MAAVAMGDRGTGDNNEVKIHNRRRAGGPLMGTMSCAD